MTSSSPAPRTDRYRPGLAWFVGVGSLWVFVLVFLVFFGKLFLMQVVQGADVAASVIEQNTVSVEVPATRGSRRFSSR